MTRFLNSGVNNGWANTTVVYGPIAQIIFKICTLISFKNINLCLLIFKLINLFIHIANCYLIFKITNKKKFSVIYGLNPFVLFEFIGMVHNDIIVVFFILLALYFLLKKKKIILSILSLAIATGIKYFTILLLPVIVLYYIRKEENLKLKIFNCIFYVAIFLVALGIEYLPYFRNVDIILAMMAQTSKYSRSIYSVLTTYFQGSLSIIQNTISLLFIAYAIYYCIYFLLKKNNNIMKMLRKYNVLIVLFLLILTTFQPWYLVWLFPTMMWQKSRTIKNIIGISLISEIANSVYMFASEWYIYDIIFINGIISMFVIWNLINMRKEIKELLVAKNIVKRKEQ